MTYISASPIKGMMGTLLLARPVNTVLEMRDATLGMSLRGLRYSAVFLWTHNSASCFSRQSNLVDE